MSLVGLLIFLIVVGVVYWLITLLPLPAPFKTIVTVLFVLIVLVWLLQSFGVFTGGPIRLR